MHDWKHDDLAEDLAVAKGGIPYLNVCLGSTWTGKNKTPRADLLVCRPSYKKFLITIYEVKLTRSDFLSDIRTGKWEHYLAHCDRFYFAVKKGIADKSEIPDCVGLVVRGEKGWHTAKASTKLNTEIHEDTLKSLIFAKQRRSYREKRLDDVQDMESNQYYRRQDFSGRLKASRVLGKNWGALHESAMNFGGLEKATSFLTDNRFTEY